MWFVKSILKDIWEYLNYLPEKYREEKAERNRPPLKDGVMESPTTESLAGIERAKYGWWRNQEKVKKEICALEIDKMRELYNLCNRMVGEGKGRKKKGGDKG